MLFGIFDFGYLGRNIGDVNNKRANHILRFFFSSNQTNHFITNRFLVIIGDEGVTYGKRFDDDKKK